jgi:hypothetical protein
MTVPTDFSKLYHSFFMSSITEESSDTRVVFLALIALSDENGNLTATPRRIAEFAKPGRPQDSPERRLELTLEALERLQLPDPDSTTPDNEGRRVLKTGPNQWHITTRLKYLEMKKSEDRRAYKREKERQREERKRAVSSGDLFTDLLPDSTSGHAAGHPSISTSNSNSLSFESRYLEGKPERPHALPDDWPFTEALARYGAEWGLEPWETEAVHLEFVDYWRSCGGNNLKRNWLLTEKKRIREVSNDPRERLKVCGRQPNGKGTNGSGTTGKAGAPAAGSRFAEYDRKTGGRG